MAVDDRVTVTSHLPTDVAASYEQDIGVWNIVEGVVDVNVQPATSVSKPTLLSWFAHPHQVHRTNKRPGLVPGPGGPDGSPIPGVIRSVSVVDDDIPVRLHR
jgi:hypothetical protein